MRSRARQTEQEDKKQLCHHRVRTSLPKSMSSEAFITGVVCILSQSYEAFGFGKQFEESKLFVSAILSSKRNCERAFIPRDYERNLPSYSRIEQPVESAFRIGKVSERLRSPRLRSEELFRG